MTQAKQEETDNSYVCRVNVDITNPDQAKIDENGRIHTRIQRKQCQAVIIHPSLGAPLLIEAGKAISFFILSDQVLYDLHRSSNSRNGNGLEVRQVIGLHARYQVFDESLNDKTQPVTKGELICKDRASLQDNLTYQYMGDIRDLGGRLQNFDQARPFTGLLHPIAQNHYMHLGLRHVFEVTIEGLSLEAGKLYDLSWVGYNKDKEPPLFEWQDAYSQDILSKDKRIPDDQRFAYNVSPLSFKPNKSLPLENHHPIWVVPGNKPRLGIGHLTDVHVSSRQHALRKSRATLIPKGSPEIGPQVNTSFDNLRDLMNQFGEDPEIDLLIFTGDLIDYGRNYNPEVLPKDNTGTLWQEMNLDRLNLRNDKGELVRQDGRIQPDTQRYPKGIDNTLVYSLLLWYMKTYKKPFLITSGNHEAYTLPYGISPRVKLSWSAGTLVKEKSPFSGKTDQESVIEDSVNTTRTHQDDVSKRGVQFYSSRANEGVAADHNLTIPEATLMYGPDYARVIADGSTPSSGRRNFNPANLDWFTLFYTPLSDYTMTWQEQCFIVLGWGQDEKMAAFGPIDGQAEGKLETFGIGGVLPRATEALSDLQQDLIERALNFNKACNILCAHFTLVNFAQDRPIKGGAEPVAKRHIHYQTLGSQWQDELLRKKQQLEREAEVGGLDLRYDGSSQNALGEVTDTYLLVPRGAEGQVDYTNPKSPLSYIMPNQWMGAIHNHFGPHDTGTFEQNRHFLYSLLASNKIQYTLSGHSHRAALYTPLRAHGWKRSILDVRSHADQQGVYPSQSNDKARLIVSASGGPIACQNHEGELFSWGLDTPSGSYIKFSGSQEKEIGLKRAQVSQAKPRLAVSLDYADLMCRDKYGQGVFSKFESQSDDGPFTIEINPRVKMPVEDWIDSIVLWTVDGKSTKAYGMLLQKVNNGYSAELVIDKKSLNSFSDRDTQLIFFLSIHLKLSLVDKLPTDYDVVTSWCFQVQVLSKAQIIKSAYDTKSLYPMDPSAAIALEFARQISLKNAHGKGYIIRRHSKWGEVPWHWKYSQIDQIEYNYPWKTSFQHQKKKKQQ